MQYTFYSLLKKHAEVVSENIEPLKWKENTQLRKDHQNRKLQKGGGGGALSAAPAPPFVVAAQRAAPILLWSFLNSVLFYHFRGALISKYFGTLNPFIFHLVVAIIKKTFNPPLDFLGGLSKIIKKILS